MEVDGHQASPRLLIAGRIADVTTLQLGGLIVRAFDRQLRDEVLLGEVVPGADGRYSITYSAENLARPDKSAPDLEVRAYDEHDRELARSEVRFNAGPYEEIDLWIPDPLEGSSDFERHMAALRPELGGMEVGRLVEGEEHQDLSFLAGATGIARDVVGILRDSHRLAAEPSFAPGRETQPSRGRARPARDQLPPEVHYAWLRKGLPADPDSLWSTRPQDLVDTLRAAIAERLVPERLNDELDDLEGRIRARAIDHQLSAAPDGRPANVGDVLRTLPDRLAPAKERAAAEILLEVPVDDPEFTKRLQEAKLTGNEATGVERSARLARLAGEHPPILTALQQAVADDHDGTLSGLAKIQPGDWLNLAYEHGTPAGSTLEPHEYAARLEASVEELHPTATLLGRLDRGSLDFDHPGRDVAKAYLERHPGLDLVAVADIERLREEDPDLTSEGADALRTLRDLKRHGARWSETVALSNLGLRGTGQVADAEPQALALRLADDMPADRVGLIHESAALARDTAIGIMVQVSPRFAQAGGPAPSEAKALAHVLSAENEGALAEPGVIDSSLLGDTATLRRLFGDLDDCGCEHCQSMTGPCAYDAELLHVISRSECAWRRLLKTRNDYVDLEYSCANAETLMPHIDRVNEVLENAVALPYPVPLPPGQSADAVLATIPLHDSIYQALKWTCLSISDRNDLRAQPEAIPLLRGETTAWVVRDRGTHKRWTLHRVTESLTLTRPGSSPLVLGLGALTPFSAASELDDKQIPNALRQALDQGLGSQRLRLFDATITPIEPGERWRLEYKLGVRIAIDVPGHTLTLEAQDGTQLGVELRPPDLLVAITKDLDAGRADGVVTAFLGTLSSATVTVDQQGKRWTITSDLRTAELTFHRDQLLVASLSYQASMSTSSEDLVALPENRNPIAYDGQHLGGARFPWTLPFDLPLLEVRAYLQRARTSRLELMETLAPWARLKHKAIAREIFGLSEAQFERITAKPADSEERWRDWGLDVKGNRATIRDASVDKDVKDEPLELLGRASILLQQSRLSWPELLAVIDTDYLSKPKLTPQPAGECRLSRVRLKIKAEHLDRIHRFTRLWRALGWRVDEVDIAQRTFNLDLVKLAAVERLRRRLDLPVDEILTWWTGLGGRVYRAYDDDGGSDITPVFERVFHNPALGASVVEQLRLSADRTALAGAATTGSALTLSEHLDLISAALGVPGGELADLIRAPESTIADKLDLLNLSKLHAVVSLTRALGLRVEDYPRARRISGRDPLSDPVEAVRFAEAVNFVPTSGFSMEELAFLLRGEIEAGSTLPLEDDRVQAILLRITELPPDPAGNGGPPMPQAPAETTRAARVTALLANELRLNAALLAPLLLGNSAGLQLHYPGENRAAIEALLEVQPPAADGPVNAPAAEIVVRRLHKTALVWERLKIGPVDLRWIGPPMKILDPDDLPDQRLGPADPTSAFEPWQGLVALCAMRAKHPHTDELLARYCDRLRENPADVDGARGEIATALTIDRDEVDQAFGDLGLGLAASDIDKYSDPRRLGQVLAALALARRLGAPWSQLKLLAEPSPRAEAAVAARQLLSAKYGAERWRDVVKPVSDQLRERQRDALVDYLVARNQLRDADELYDYFLIDVQRSPCFMTSRLVEATGGKQHLIERLSLGLESGCSLAPQERERLPYILDYRLWEAGLNVFLHPWHFLHAELRDDMTQAARNHARALTQGEASADTAREAFLGYLEELDELDQMKVLALHEHVPDPASGGPSVLYVIGRSPDKPYEHYLRTCSDFGVPERMRWTGWERLDFDIPGDHVIPFVFEGDLHVAWPSIRRTGSGREEEQPLQISLAWSRRTAKGWTKRKVSKDPLSNSPTLVPGRTETDGLAFQVENARPFLDWLGLPDRPGWNLPNSLRDIAFEEVRIRCFAGIPRDPPPMTARIDESPTYILLYREIDHFEDLSAELQRAAAWTLIQLKGYRTVWTYQIMVYKTSNGRYWVADDVEVNAQFTGEADPRSLGRTRGGFLSGGETSQVSADALSFSISATDQTHTSPPSRLVTIQGYARSVDVTATLVIPTDEEPPPRTEIPEGIPIDMFEYGEFVFSSGRDVASWDGSRALNAQDFLEGTISYGGGYREALPRSDGTFRLRWDLVGPKPPELLRSSPGRFAAVGPRPESPRRQVWHYADDVARYYLDSPGSGTDGADGTQEFGGRGDGDVTVEFPTTGAMGALPESPKVLVLSDKLGIAPLFRVVASSGSSALYDLESVTDAGAALDSQFAGAYTIDPNSITAQGVSFEQRSPKAVYMWETWLHTQMRAWQHLAKAGHFDEALLALTHVRDPDGNTGWRFIPFQRIASGESLRDILAWIGDPTGHADAVAAFKQQLRAWRADPFQPFAVARWRPSEFAMRAETDRSEMWMGKGDESFHQGGRTALERAARDYVQAARLLGPRPIYRRAHTDREPLSYRDLAGRPADYSYAWERILDEQSLVQPPGSPNGAAPSPGLRALGSTYFCVPPDSYLQERWDRVERRLWNLRHCRDIDGNSLDLPLYDPPIDPDLLVRARAAGLDIDAVVRGLRAPPPRWRCSYLLRKNGEAAAELVSIEDVLFAAREKHDADEQALMQSAHGIELLKLASEIKGKQIKEAEASLEALKQGRANAGEKWAHYQRLLGKQGVAVPPVGTRAPRIAPPFSIAPAGPLYPVDASLGLISTEVQHLELTQLGRTFTMMMGIGKLAAAVAYAVGVYPLAAPSATAVGGGLSNVADQLGTAASAAGQLAGAAATFASYERRRIENAFQSNVWAGELDQLGGQILPGEIQLEIRKLDLESNERQLQHAIRIDEYQRHEKYMTLDTQRERVEQANELRFAMLQLMQEIKEEVRAAYKFELGEEPPSADLSGPVGAAAGRDLLAGRRLQYELRRLEVAYNNKRAEDRDQHILKFSLRKHDPLALLELRATGVCSFRITELDCDLHHPGQWDRRIKAIFANVHCVVSSNETLDCVLTKEKSSRRTSADRGSAPVADRNGICRIPINSGRRDSGRFELNLNDDLLLPGEHEGLISEWTLEIASPFHGYDPGTIADVVLEIMYTARTSSPDVAKAAVIAIKNAIKDSTKTPLGLLVSLRHDLTDEWPKLADASRRKLPRTTVTVKLDQDAFPVVFQPPDWTVAVQKIELYLKLAPDALANFAADELKWRVTTPQGNAWTGGNLDELLVDESKYEKNLGTGGVFTGAAEPGGAAQGGAPGDWKLEIWRAGLVGSTEAIDAAAVKDLLVVCHYTAKPGA